MKRTIILILFIICKTSLSAQNTNLSSGTVFDGEPYLSINPSNFQHIVVAWLGYLPFNYIVIKTKASFDGGQTWSSTNNIPHTNPVYGSADPSLEFDNSGNVFLCYIDYDVSIDSGSVYVRKSTDGGLNWNVPVEVINVHSDPGKYPCDRPWISIDRSGGSNDGYIYITTMPPNVFGPLPPPYHPYFIRSIDGGNSFEQWKYLDTAGWLAGNIIPQPTPFSTVSSNGIFYSVFPSWVLSQNLNPQFILASSANAGTSFTYKIILTYPFNIVVNDTLSKKGFPLIANPSNQNHLVFFNLFKIHGDADVFMWESFDGGNTWSDSIRINDDTIGNNRMQDLIWADFDTDGDLVVSWRDRRNALDSTYSTSSEIWGAVRHKDSTDFYQNFKISDTIVTYDSILSSSGNDFMCIKLRDDTLNAVWGDTRNGKLNIWFQRMSLSGVILSTQQLASEVIPPILITPNPTNHTVSIEGEKIRQLIIHDMGGKELLHIDCPNEENKITLNLEYFPKGVYLIRILTEQGFQTGKIIKD